MGFYKGLLGSKKNSLQAINVRVVRAWNILSSAQRTKLSGGIRKIELDAAIKSIQIDSSPRLDGSVLLGRTFILPL